MDRTQMDEIKVSTPYGLVAGRAAGPAHGSVILGLHGWSERNGWHIWEPVLPLLAADGYRAMSIDMPGWGDSESTYSREQIFAESVPVVLSVLDGLALDEPAILMGSSWGGGVALSLALAQPERVSHLLLTAPAFREKERLTSLGQPVLLVWAQDDPVIPVESADEYREVVPTIEVVVYPTGGHRAAPSNAADFAERAVAFLSVHNDN